MAVIRGSLKFDEVPCFFLMAIFPKFETFSFGKLFRCQVLPKRLQLSVALASARLTEAAGVKVDLEPRLKLTRQALHFQEVHRSSIALLISIMFGPTSSCTQIISAKELFADAYGGLAPIPQAVPSIHSGACFGQMIV